MYEHLESQVQFHYSLLFHRITQKKRTEWVLRSLAGGCLLNIWVWLTGRVLVVTVGQTWALMWLQKAALHQSGNVEQSSCCPLINLPLTLPSKWLTWMLHHFLIKAYFQRELPVFRKIRLPSCCCFLHLKLYSLCTLKKKNVIKRYLKHAPKFRMMNTFFVHFSEWDTVVIATWDCYNNKTNGPILPTGIYIYQNDKKYHCYSFGKVMSHILSTPFFLI